MLPKESSRFDQNLLVAMSMRTKKEVDSSPLYKCLPSTKKCNNVNRSMVAVPTDLTANECAELVAGVCAAFYQEVYAMCVASFLRASEYKQIACSYNEGCC